MPKKPRQAEIPAVKQPISSTPPEGSSLATPESVAASSKSKTAQPSTLAFKPGAKRKSLIEWNPSRQAQILDWHHRAKDYGLAVEEREDLEEGQPFEVEDGA